MKIKGNYHYVIIIILAFLASGCKNGMTDLREKAVAIHDRALTVDTHTDTPMKMVSGDIDIGGVSEPEISGSKVDLPRMKKGGLDAIFFAIFINQGARTPEGDSLAKERTYETYRAIKESATKYDDLAELAFNPDDAYSIEKKGKRALFIGIENGYAIGKDISNVRDYFDLGVRYITLCHNQNNDICDSSTDIDGPEHNGLSDFGREVVKEMNRLGMIIDVSHISDKSFYDVIELSKAPVMASHSCSRAICDHPRNPDDNMLKKLADNDGVIQVCFVSDFVKDQKYRRERDSLRNGLRKKYNFFNDLTRDQEEMAHREWHAIDSIYPKEEATVSELVDHIDHIVELIGIEHVGIGSDFDGGGSLEDCNDVSELENITIELLRRGYNEEQIRKIWGGNFMRVFRKVQEVAQNPD